VQVENVPPEEFIISKKARKMADSPFVAHRRIISRGDLIAMGFDKDVVEGLPIGDTLTYNPERVIRYEQSEQPEDNQSLDPAMQDIEVYECYIRADMDDDGIAELRQVFYAGNEILSEEETDYVPFYSICPIPIPHKFFGQSFADRTTDIQLIKTTILRQMLDNLYLTNNARVVAVEGQVNLDDLADQHGRWRYPRQVTGRCTAVKCAVYCGSIIPDAGVLRPDSGEAHRRF
jgi:hypothetical protein